MGCRFSFWKAFLNRKTHPGEKRLITLCGTTCPILPDRFKEKLDRLFSHMFVHPQQLTEDPDRILTELGKIL